MTYRAFTIGNPEVYDHLLGSVEDTLTKVGAHDGYEGGIVFPNQEEAETWLDAHGWVLAIDGGENIEMALYVFDLLSGWETDVFFEDPHDDGSFRLKHDARILMRIR